jgi:hypothetical protein
MLPRIPKPGIDPAPSQLPALLIIIEIMVSIGLGLANFGLGLITLAGSILLTVLINIFLDRRRKKQWEQRIKESLRE